MVGMVCYLTGNPKGLGFLAIEPRFSLSLKYLLSCKKLNCTLNITRTQERLKLSCVQDAKSLVVVQRPDGSFTSQWVCQRNVARPRERPSLS